MNSLEDLLRCLVVLRENGLNLDRHFRDIPGVADFSSVGGLSRLTEVEIQHVWMKPRFRVSEAASLSGMHPQTLRQYDRLGLVVPGRTLGGTRRYSLRDLAHLFQVQQLSQDDGVNLAGISQIMSLQQRVEELEARNSQLERVAGVQGRVFAASSRGEVTSLSRGERAERSREVGFPVRRGSALVLWGRRQ